MNIAIFGSRDIPIEQSKQVFDLIQSKVNLLTADHIVSGGAKGADTIAEIIAKEHSIKTLIFKPDWTKHGKAAGMVRNTDIVKNADMGFAIVNKPLQESKGTFDSFKKFLKAGKPVFLIDLLRCTIEECTSIPALP